MPTSSIPSQGDEGEGIVLSTFRRRQLVPSLVDPTMYSHCIGVCLRVYEVERKVGGGDGGEGVQLSRNQTFDLCQGLKGLVPRPGYRGRPPRKINDLLTVLVS